MMKNIEVFGKMTGSFNVGKGMILLEGGTEEKRSEELFEHSQKFGTNTVALLNEEGSNIFFTDADSTFYEILECNLDTWAEDLREMQEKMNSIAWIMDLGVLPEGHWMKSAEAVEIMSKFSRGIGVTVMINLPESLEVVSELFDHKLSI
jgi:hypothetical protein